MGPLHRFQIRVYWEDTDAGGIVYHSNYLSFAERGRTEYLRELGVNQSDLAHDGYAFAVSKADVSFLKSAKLDDLLVIESQLAELGGATVRFHQCIKRVDDGAELVRLNIRVGFIAVGAGRPARLPQDLKSKLLDKLNERQS
jgi:acyl-CoA thioester hydrolase